MKGLPIEFKVVASEVQCKDPNRPGSNDDEVVMGFQLRFKVGDMLQALSSMNAEQTISLNAGMPGMNQGMHAGMHAGMHGMNAGPAAFMPAAPPRPPVAPAPAWGAGEPIKPTPVTRPQDSRQNAMQSRLQAQRDQGAAREIAQAGKSDGKEEVEATWYSNVMELSKGTMSYRQKFKYAPVNAKWFRATHDMSSGSGHAGDDGAPRRPDPAGKEMTATNAQPGDTGHGADGKECPTQ